MKIIIYKREKQTSDINVSEIYRNESLLDDYIDDFTIINPWWWTDQIFKDNEIINAELRNSYIIYKRLTPADKPQYCDNKQYNVLDKLFSDFNFEKFDYIIKCTW